MNAADMNVLAEEIAEAVPTSWLDSMLTGPDRVAKFQDGRPVEALLRAVKERVRQTAVELLARSIPVGQPEELCAICHNVRWPSAGRQGHDVAFGHMFAARTPTDTPNKDGR